MFILLAYFVLGAVCTALLGFPGGLVLVGAIILVFQAEKSASN